MAQIKIKKFFDSDMICRCPDVIIRRIRNIIYDADRKYENVRNIKFYCGCDIYNLLKASGINGIYDRYEGRPYTCANLAGYDVHDTNRTWAIDTILDETMAINSIVMGFETDSENLPKESPRVYFSKNTIKKVIFNNPATIVLWKDGTKTVVTCQKGDIYDQEKGLALCVAKKALGNTSRALNDLLDEHIPVEDPEGRYHKGCSNCKYGSFNLNVEPCKSCDRFNSKWKKASTKKDRKEEG